MSASEGVQPETLGLAASAPKLTLGLMADLIICLPTPGEENTRAELKRAANVRACFY
jgi:hypothetical protein